MLSSLAHSGVILEQHYSQRWCAPARTALMTGRYPYNTGMTDYGHVVAEERSAVPIAFHMLPRLLSTHNYRSYHLGKWHLGFWSTNHTPAGRGFDQSFGFMLGDSTHDTRGSQITHTCGQSIKDLYNGSAVSSGPANDSRLAYDNMYSSYMYGNLSLRVIHDHARNHPGVPMFLYYASQNAHSPYQCPDEYLDLYPNLPKNGSRRCFNGMVSAMDRGVAAIVRALKDTGMYDNTVIVYSSDNGGPAHWSSNLPLRGAKFSVFEGGVRVPAFVHSPLLPASVVGTVNRDLFYIADWYTTFASLAGVPDKVVQKHSGPVRPDGRNIWAQLSKTETAKRDLIVHEYDTVKNIYAVRYGEWKLVWGAVGESKWIPDRDYGSCSPLEPYDPPNAVSAAGSERVTLEDKLSTSQATQPASVDDVNTEFDLQCTERAPCLFNVVKDPTEHNECAAEHPHVVAELQKQLHEYVSADQYHGGLDVANSTSEKEYCEKVVKKLKWVQPYEQLR